MITKEILKKEFNIKSRKMNEIDFIEKFITPLEIVNNGTKTNLSETHDEYLINIKTGNI